MASTMLRNLSLRGEPGRIEDWFYYVLRNLSLRGEPGKGGFIV